MDKPDRDVIALWMEDALRRKPHLSQSGLADRLGSHRSKVTKMLNGSRKVSGLELPIIETYLEEVSPLSGIDVVGIISSAWYETGTEPRVAERIPRSHYAKPLHQCAFLVQSDMPMIRAGDGDIAIGVAVNADNQPIRGDLVVCRQSRGGLHNLSVGRYVSQKEIEGIRGAADIVAVLVEIRRRP
jgi:hypothetical protein